VIAATNRNLEEAVSEGSFREDLYYRLNVVVVHLPPLRDRIDAVPLLADHFLQMYNEQYNKTTKQVSASTLDVLMKYHWPGNVRELENMIKRMVVLGTENAILQEVGTRKAPAEREDLERIDPLGADFSEQMDFDLKAISKRAAQVAEKRVIARVLERTRWNRKEAAEQLQISYKALLYKMKENGLSQSR
jgi:two-component system response regulator AtoC